MAQLCVKLQCAMWSKLRLLDLLLYLLGLLCSYPHMDDFW